LVTKDGKILNSEEKNMNLALRLAGRGIGSVEPNPAVGAVIVKDGQIAGKGWHKKYGGPHAEINALEDCKSKGANPEGATLYVTLEPCCHYGKTPPCTDAIIKAGLSEVVVAMVDPSKHAGGRGIEILRDAGIEVRTGICEREAKELNAPFIKFAATGESWVIVKWAQSIDGKLAYAEGVDGRWISNKRSRRDAHKLRRRVQGILVGIGTLLSDDPLLTPRPSRCRMPVRIVLDSNLRLPLDCNLLRTTGEASVLVVTTKRTAERRWEIVRSIEEMGGEILTVETGGDGCDLRSLLGSLSKRGIAQLLVEGGGKIIGSFLKEGLADEVCVYVSSKLLGRSGRVDISESTSKILKGVELKGVNIRRFGDDVKITGLLR